MSLVELKVEDLRCLQHVELVLHPRLNLIWGSNGSGKTSILEALFLLGRGRSFRTRNSERLIRHGQQQLIVFGRTDDTPTRALGLQVSAGGTLARVNGAPARSLTELSQCFPVQVIDPGVHKLVEEGGHRRRRWLDWAVFHVEPAFADTWGRYTRTLKQRNAALKHEPSQAHAWDPELARLGEQIAASRRSLIDRLQPVWQQTAQALVGTPIDLHYHQGWAHDAPLAQSLVDGRQRDLTRGLTHSGPHRGDVGLRIAGKLAREVLSRGQQKLVAIALIVSQLRLLKDLIALRPTLLLDDPAAELDGAHLSKFIEAVNGLQCQLVITSLRAEASSFGTPEQVCHVERGGIRPV